MLHALLLGAVAQPAPDAALLRWANSIPEVRCVPAAFASWTNARTDADAADVPITPISGKLFSRSGLRGRVGAATVVAGGRDGDTYRLARVVSSGDVVLGFDGAGGEDTFTAVVAGAAPPPRAVAAFSAAPRTSGGIGLGSARAAAEAALGPGRAKTLCGFDVVHYSQAQPRASVAELWLFYRDGVVVAIAYVAGV